MVEGWQGVRGKREIITVMFVTRENMLCDSVVREAGGLPVWLAGNDRCPHQGSAITLLAS